MSFIYNMEPLVKMELNDIKFCLLNPSTKNNTLSEINATYVPYSLLFKSRRLWYLLHHLKAEDYNIVIAKDHHPRYNDKICNFFQPRHIVTPILRPSRQHKNPPRSCTWLV